jgi:hypothetical protein
MTFQVEGRTHASGVSKRKAFENLLFQSSEKEDVIFGCMELQSLLMCVKI